MNENLNLPTNENTEVTNEEVTPIQNQGFDFNEEFKPKKSKKKFLILGTILLVVIALGFVGYKIFLNNPKTIFLKSINQSFEQLNALIDTGLNNELITKDTVSINSNTKYNLQVDENTFGDIQSLLDEFNKLSFEINGIIDNKNKEMNYALNLNYNQTRFLELGLYAQKQNIYLELKNIFDKYIEIPIENYDELFNQNQKSEDIKNVLDIFKETLVKHIDEKDFQTSNETLSLNGETIKTKKITYTLDTKKILNISKAIITDLEKNNDFISALANISGQSNEEIKNLLKETIDEIDTELNLAEEPNANIEISIYTKGLFNETIKYEIIITDDDGKIVDINWTNYNDNITFNLENDGEQIIEITHKKTSTNKYKTTINIQTFKAIIDSTIDSDKSTHEFIITESESNIEIKGSLEYLANGKSDINTKIKLSLNISVDEVKDAIVLSIENESTTKYNEKTTLPNLQNSVSFDAITEEELNEIYEAIYNNPTINIFITKINDLYNTEPDYDDDYNWN